ncbi:carbohydrate ABC transporter permease [Paenibacillus sp. J5C_2022]|uniref:carbohydrate ABC transporter permease n=1 Tax=Paenibacillus sp. J5C2022 TaxID=2977129 RepID=UPI0021D117E5|nr:carbohydrate ABC transporter permease [Paenibacillus sp. J5C2022]MCU6708847.1 carbohydrate ABC transporter permease [Paenibacillus sp. J5C2022]
MQAWVKPSVRRLYWKQKTWRNGLRSLSPAGWLLVVLLLLLTVFMLLPLVYIFNHAFKPLHELLLFPPTFIVRDPTFGNFIELLSMTKSTFVPVSRYVFNSVVVTGLTTIGMVATGALCAYPLSKHPFPGAKLIFGTIVISLLFVSEILAIPRYVIVQSLGIMNTFWGHILPLLALPVGVFLLKQFMDQIPNELLEAAKIDGANEARIFVQIVLPVVSPAMATVTILAFQTAWSNVETSNLFMQDDSMKTLPFYLSTLNSNLANLVARQGAVAVGSLIMFLPSLLIFLIYQRKVIATMVHSGIK